MDLNDLPMTIYKLPATHYLIVTWYKKHVVNE